MLFDFDSRRYKKLAYFQVRNNVYRLVSLVHDLGMSTAEDDGYEVMIKEPYRSDMVVLEKMYKAVERLDYDSFMERYGKDYRRFIAYYFF